MRRFPPLCTSALLVVLAAGCTPVVETPAPLPPVAGSCVAEDANWAIGQAASAANIERATLDAGARTARVIQPGQAVTQDFSPDRLNIHVDERERIVELRCG